MNHVILNAQKLVRIFSLILIGFVVVAVTGISPNHGGVPSLYAQTLETNKAIAGALVVQNAFRNVAKSVTPSVVNISSETVIRNEGGFPQGDPFSQFFGDDFFKQFFDIPKEYKQRSLGTGFIISEDGYLLSNVHVIKNATKIMVTLQDGRKFKAKVIGQDPKTDVSILKIEAHNLKVANLGDSEKVEVGDWAIAIGNPFGLSETFTMGVISAKGRNQVGVNDGGYEDFLQTDAPINPGNSGGPLVNIFGEVVGINTAIATPSGGNVGIGFAIPINMVKSEMEQLKINGKVQRGWLGIQIQDLTEEIAKPLKVEPNSGVLIADVTHDSPASKSDLKVGDIIIGYNGIKITGVDQLRKSVALTKPGAEVKIKVLRGGAEKIFNVTVGEMPSNPEISSENPGKTEKWLGMTVSGLTPDLRQQFKLSPNDNGLLITEMEQGSVSQDAGLQPGDLILKINNIEMKSMKDYGDFIKANKAVSSFLFLVMRQGQTVFIGVDTGNE